MSVFCYLIYDNSTFCYLFSSDTSSRTVSMMVFCASTPSSVVNHHCFYAILQTIMEKGRKGGEAMVVPTNVSGSINFKWDCLLICICSTLYSFSHPFNILIYVLLYFLPSLSFMCGEKYHAPTDCYTIKKWLTKCEDDSETANYITANTKDVSII